MQKEKEQKDKLNAVKARLIYGEESGIKIRSREESHYSESKTPTARTEPRRRRQQKGTPSRTTSQYSESEDSEGVTGNLSQEGRDQTPMKMISPSLGHVRR
ncbi:hypothetical protein Tco_0338449 [Tanacetum coccineum]